MQPEGNVAYFLLVLLFRIQALISEDENSINPPSDSIQDKVVVSQ